MKKTTFLSLFVALLGLFVGGNVKANNACSPTFFEKIDTVGPCSVEISRFDTILQPGHFALHAEPNGEPPFQYRWTTFDGQEMGFDRLPNLHIWNSDLYCVLVKDATGCVAFDCHDINLDSIYCRIWMTQTVFPDSAVLGFFSYSTGYSSIQWSSGQTTPSITTTEPGSYSVTVTNEFGCTSTDVGELIACNQLSVWVNMSDSLDGVAAMTYLYDMATQPPTFVDSLPTNPASGLATYYNLPTGLYTASATLLQSSPWYNQYETVNYASTASDWQNAQTDSVKLFCGWEGQPNFNIYLHKKPGLLAENAVLPNPVTDVLYVNVVQEPFFYRLLDQNGQVKESGNVPAQFSPYPIAMQQYGNGVYFLQIQLSTGWQTFRIIKM